MNKTLVLTVLGAALSSFAAAQTSNFNFGSAASQPQDTFTSNGFSVTLDGLASSTALNQNLASVILNAHGVNIAKASGAATDQGLGTVGFSDSEMRNGSGTPFNAGAQLLEISHIGTPHGTSPFSLDIAVGSVDKSTNEGFLIYGSTQDASKGTATLTLLDHGFGNSSDNGSFVVDKSMLNKYSSFYVTSDNGKYSSVLLGYDTKVCAAVATPEPMSMAGLALGAVALLRRRKKA